MVQKLSVQIQLEGAKQIEQELAGVSKAGQQCFADISKAAEQAGGFAKLDPAILQQKFQQLGVTATEEIKKITAAVEQAGRLEGMVLGVSNLEKNFKKLGTTASEASSIFGRFGSVVDNVLPRIDVGIRKVAASFTRVLGPIGAFARGLGPIGIAAGSIGAGSVALVKFAIAAEETEKALTQLQKVSGQSFASLSVLSNVFAKGGTPLKQFATEFGNLAEKIASAGEEATKQKAIKKQAEDADKGLKVTELGAITLNERVTALLETLSRVPPTEQWFALADIFKNLGSEVERARLGKALGLSPESIATLDLGSAKLRAMAEEAKQLGLALDNVDNKNLSQLREGQTRASTLFDQLKDKMGALVAPALTSFWQGFTNQIQKLVPTFLQMAQTFGQLDFSKLGAAAADFLLVLGKIAVGWASVISGQVSLSDALGETLKQAGELLAKMAIDIGIAIGQGIVNGILSALAGIAQKIKEALGLGGGGGVASPGFIGPVQPAGGFIGPVQPAGMASGGLLGGRGSGTSDSNLAWVSRGEYITPARAVSQPGVLAFLEALRRSGGNLSRVLNGMGRFALGGIVPRTMPAFASGGLAGGSNVTIQFPGLPPIGGLRASSAVVGELQKAAALAQVRSGGRKPSRYS